MSHLAFAICGYEEYSPKLLDNIRNAKYPKKDGPGYNKVRLRPIQLWVADIKEESKIDLAADLSRYIRDKQHVERSFNWKALKVLIDNIFASLNIKEIDYSKLDRSKESNIYTGDIMDTRTWLLPFIGSVEDGFFKDGSERL